MTEVELLAWRDLDPPSVASVGRRLREEGVEPSAWSNGPGDRYGGHRHGYTKLLMCAAGSITFLVGEAGTAVELRPGEGFVLPAGIEQCRDRRAGRVHVPRGPALSNRRVRPGG